MNAQPTVKTAIDEADRLRLRAEFLTRPDSPGHDPYARPYWPPPTSEAVEKMVQRTKRTLVTEALDSLPAHATDSQRQEATDKATARAPAAAIEEMRSRATAAGQARRDERQRDENARNHLANHQRKAARDRDHQLRDLTPGQRIDRALASLSVVAAPSGTDNEAGVRISGTSHRDAPPFAADPVAKARHLAITAVRDIEGEVQRAQRRVVESELAA